jgi:hypothetical protein
MWQPKNFNRHPTITIFGMATELFLVTTKGGCHFFGKLLSKVVERFFKNVLHAPFLW